MPTKETPGQRLCELKCPRLIRVVLFDGRQFAKLDDSFLVPNPHHFAAWEFLTEASRQEWERTAVGHHLITINPKKEG